MKIQLSPESHALVQQLVALGKYESPEAVVEAGLEILRERLDREADQSSPRHVNPLTVEELGPRDL